MPCPTCGAETHEGQHFCMDCGAALDGSTAAPTRRQPAVGGPPSVAPTTVIPITGPVGATLDATRPASPPPEPVPIRIVEQTTPIPLAGAAEPRQEEVAGMVWHPMSVDPWPTPRHAPTIVGAAVRPAPLSIAGVIAAALGIAGSLTTIGSYQFADGTAARFTLDDLRSNSSGVMIAVAAVLAVGLGLALARQRIGIGLAGGAAVALTGLATMDVALVVAQLHNARDAGVATGSVTITWEPAFYAIVAAGVLGLIATAIALGAWREEGPPVHAAIAVLGAAAVATMIVGTLVPTSGRTWGDNLHILGFSELPSSLRLAALALVGIAGLVGFLARRRWTTGLAVGTTTALAAQWIGTVSPPQPNTRGGPGLAITPLEDSALTIHAVGLGAVVILALAGWLIAERSR